MSAWLDDGSGGRTIRLSVPGRLEYRDLSIRVVAAACKLAKRPADLGLPEGEASGASRDFDHQVISAFGEAFNNVAIHAYRNRPMGAVEIEIELATECLTLRICDYGKSFDFLDVREPDFSNLPESGWGLYIIRSFMDEVSYSAGSPNVLSISKKYRSPLPRPGENEQNGEPKVKDAVETSDASDGSGGAGAGVARQPQVTNETAPQVSHARGTAR